VKIKKAGHICQIRLKSPSPQSSPLKGEEVIGIKIFSPTSFSTPLKAGRDI
jgi:hypothetical protein